MESKGLATDRERLVAFIKDVTTLLEDLEGADDERAAEILVRMRTAAKDVGFYELLRATETVRSALKTPQKERQLQGFINEARSLIASLAKLLGYSKKSSSLHIDLSVGEGAAGTDEADSERRKLITILQSAPRVDADVDGLVNAAFGSERPSRDGEAKTEIILEPQPLQTSSTGAKHLLASMGLAALDHAKRLLPDSLREKAALAATIIHAFIKDSAPSDTISLASQVEKLALWLRGLAERMGCRIKSVTQSEGVFSEKVCGFMVECAKNILLAGLPLRGRPTPEDATLTITMSREEDSVVLKLAGLAGVRRASVGLFVTELRHLLKALSGSIERRGDEVEIRLPQDVVAFEAALMRCGGLVCALPLPASPEIAPPTDTESAIVLASNPNEARLLSVAINDHIFRVVVDDYIGERTLIARLGERLCVDITERKVIPLVNPFALEEGDWL